MQPRSDMEPAQHQSGQHMSHVTCHVMTTTASPVFAVCDAGVALGASCTLADNLQVQCSAVHRITSTVEHPRRSVAAQLEADLLSNCWNLHSDQQSLI
jgi:hypothetical protein